MSGEFHGWKEEEGGWVFADVHGIRNEPNVFVIVDFGATKSVRDVLSAIMAATRQFPGRVHLRRTEKTSHFIDKLIDAETLRVAPIKTDEHEELGVLGFRRATPPKAPWWKFWS